MTLVEHVETIGALEGKSVTKTNIVIAGFEIVNASAYLLDHCSQFYDYRSVYVYEL